MVNDNNDIPQGAWYTLFHWLTASHRGLVLTYPWSGTWTLRCSYLWLAQIVPTLKIKPFINHSKILYECRNIWRYSLSLFLLTFMILLTRAGRLDPSNVFCRQAISYNIQPKAQMSDLSLYGFPSHWNIIVHKCDT